MVKVGAVELLFCDYSIGGGYLSGGDLASAVGMLNV